MSRVLARQTKSARQACGPNLLQANEANANQRVPTMELGAKWLGQDALHHGGVGAEVYKQSPLNDAFDDWNAHG
jgi:hypothetical protein